jgi:hypothetical protein
MKGYQDYIDNQNLHNTEFSEWGYQINLFSFSEFTLLRWRMTTAFLRFKTHIRSIAAGELVVDSAH